MEQLGRVARKEGFVVIPLSGEWRLKGNRSFYHEYNLYPKHNVQKAIDEAHSKIFLKDGTHTLNTALSVQKSNFQIEGESHAAVLSLNNATMSGIVFGDPAYVTPYENVQIRNLKVDSAVTKSAGSGIEFRAIQEVGALRPSLSGVFNVLIENQYDGLVLSACTGFYVKNVNVFYSVNTGTKIYNTCNAIHLTNIEIDGCKTEAYGTSKGIYLAKTIELWMTNVHITRSTVGLYIYGASTMLLGSIFINGLMASDNKDFGVQIWLTDTSTVSGIYFTNSMFATNGMLYTPYSGARGVCISSSSTGAVEGFYFSQCDFFQNGGHGFYASGGTDFRFTGCTFVNNGKQSNNAYSGAYFEAGVSNFQFVGNKFFSGVRGDVSMQAYGVYIVTGASNYYIITDNEFKGNNLGAIYNGASGAERIVRNNRGYVTENSGTSTGTGAEQTIPHGLATGLTPNLVTVIPTVTGATVSGVWADATNIYCTVTSGKAFKWSASVV